MGTILHQIQNIVVANALRDTGGIMIGMPAIFSTPKRSGVTRGMLRFGPVALLALLLNSVGFSAELPATASSHEQFSNSDPVISKLMPERAHGRGFKLEYLVNVPLDVFWKYKTSFDNELVHKNRYINSHKLVSREDNLVITETEYSYKPKDVFKWQTTVYPDRHLLEYTLLNPEECGQKYHYGHIQLEADGAGTRVTQVSYFDFFGVSLWVNYPFKGGMSQFLKYTAQWEQQLVPEFKHRYQ